MLVIFRSVSNTSNRFCISCDTRYQRADEPVDERWIGANLPAHYAWMEGESVTMEQKRDEWNLL